VSVDHTQGAGIVAPDTTNGRLWYLRPHHRPGLQAGQYRRADQSGLAYCWEGAAPLLPPQSRWIRSQLVVKRIADVILSVLALIGLSPLLLALAVLVKVTSPGPVLFWQDRVGLNGRVFKIFKFRSMSAELCDSSGVSQTKPGDTRVTPVGQIMRRTSLDELPQLVNVFLGNMSLVGPRPHVAGMFAGGTTYEELVPYYALRHAAKPGLTGWAQANGLRGVTDDPARAVARIDHDIAYIQNYSLLLDARCIAMTIRREFFTGSGV
jgi:lipopolysaccharide/colanic/teichoic acid biosynthesis glycosyltransferase